MTRLPALILTVAALFLGCEGVSAQQSWDLSPKVWSSLASAYSRADSLLFAMNPNGALDVLDAWLEWRPDDYEAHWRAARLGMVLGIVESDGDRRLTWYRLAEAHGLAALESRPDGVDGLVWTAAAKGRIAIETGGARDKARLGSEVWDLTEKILAEYPDHPMANDVRGKLNQEVMKLDGFSRFLGRMFLRSDPLRHGGWDSAESHLRKAVAGDPGMVLFYLDLGETYLLQEKWREAAETFEKGLGAADRYPTDPHFKRIMRSRLEGMSQGTGGP